VNKKLARHHLNKHDPSYMGDIGRRIKNARTYVKNNYSQKRVGAWLKC
jgi:hypothetical protein